MTEVTALPLDFTSVSRDLTPAELADLDQLRFALAAAVDRTEPRAVSWLWDRQITAHPGGPAPAGFVEAVATAIGDLLAVHVPTTRWSVWPGPSGPTLGVASAVRPAAPVLPFLDAQDRWDAGTRDWVLDYLSRAAAFLVPPGDVPRPHQSPDDEAVQTSVLVAPVSDVMLEAVPAEPALVSDEAPAAPAVAAPPAVPLDTFALDTLDHALAVLREAGAFDREAFVVLVGDTGQRTESCSGEPAASLARARALVASSGAARAAVAWVDRSPEALPGPMQRFPAVIVDAWRAGDAGLRVAHRFVDDVLGTDLLGSPLVVGPVAPLL